MKRRLRPSKLPHPIRDGFTETFFGGIGLGVVITVAVAVMFLQGVR
ncbi:MAG: hypothetical protein JWR07_1956 [Nevskia sp.]|nr:hypothetical protein [Nevskia sp.]